MTRTEIFVAGGGGTAGREYVRQLAAAGHGVRATIRPGSDPSALVALGAEAVEVDLREVDATRRAVADADAVVIALLGRGDDPAADEAHITVNVFEAAQAAASRVVYTSVHLADEPTGVAHFEVKGRLEHDLAERGIAATVLRPTTFMDALAAPWLRESTLREGVLRSPIAIDTPISYIATHDLARVAVHVIERPDMAGRTLTVAGPAAVTYADLLPLLSTLAGREIGYDQLPLDGFAQAAGPAMAAMVDLFNRRGFTADPSPVTAEFGMTLTPVEKFLAASAWAQRPESTMVDAETRP